MSTSAAPTGDPLMPNPSTAFPLRRALTGLTLTLALTAPVAAQTAAPVAAPLPAAPGIPAQVTVQPGDTAYSIARRAGLSVDALLALNSLQTPDLKVGQVLLLRSAPASHTVQPGETLYALARRYHVTVDALQAANSLTPEHKLAVGQVLTLPAGAVDGGPALVTAPATPAPATPAPAAPAALSPPLPGAAPVTGSPALPTAPLAGGDWRASALSFLGTPYVLGGTTRTGTDCSGLVLQVFTPLGVKLPRVSAAQAQVGLPVTPDALLPGDLVFFDVNQEGRVTHVGIYLGDDQFVSANSYRGQVTVDRLQADRYWAPRFVGARRVLAGVMAAKL